MSASPPTFGSKRLVVGARYGLRDWLSQRVTAIIMAVFTVVLLAQIIFGAPLDYYRWSGIFAAQWMKILTFVTLIALLLHVWVGIRDVLMDYIKPLAARLVFQVLSLVWLIGCTGWAIQVLWRL
jgi:succinate dehydrogenase / fumarate reductase, membrane anchor subunit